MGADKAFVVVRGAPLCTYPQRALLEAGARRVLAVGGARVEELRGLGFETVADRHPGEGPLGAVVTALEAATDSVVVVLACDLPAVDALAVVTLLRALRRTGAEVAVPVAAGRRQLAAGAYRRVALRKLSAAFESGIRSLHGALRALEVTEVATAAGVFDDVDEPAQLRRYASVDP
jgi:molybdopterin-guanine dinucleotide biosynthesis protein A